MYGCALLSVLLLRGFHCIAAIREEDSESELRKKLLDGYDKTLPPLLFNYRERHIIWMSLIRIRDLDEATSTLAVEAVIGMGWRDQRLIWNRTENKDMKVVGFPVSDIWTPRLWILNHVKPEERVGDTRALAFPFIVWMGLKYTLHTSCVPNLKYFPFDTHKCDIEIAAITQSGEMLELNVTLPKFFKTRGIWTQGLVENTRWKYINFSAKEENKTLLDGQVVEIELFSLEFQRTMPLVAMSIMTPSLTSLILVLSGFWIFPACPVRMGIAMTAAFVSMSTLFTLGKVLPVTGSMTPVIVEYCATSLVLILLFSIHTCLISLAIRSTTPFPFPYHVLLERIPTWARRALGSEDALPKETVMNQVLLYSELSETDTSLENSRTLSPRRSNLAESTESSANPMIATFSTTPVANSEWLKPMILLDKFCFYIYILIAVLYIISVIIVE